MRAGHDLTLIAIGGILANTFTAADKLTQAGYSVRLLSMPFAVPLDEDAIRAAANETGVILTVEEHGAGGLGAAVGECIARSGIPTTFVPLRLRRDSNRISGTQEELRGLQGLSAEDIAQSAVVACQHRAVAAL
jgi:transketolase